MGAEVVWELAVKLLLKVNLDNGLREAPHQPAVGLAGEGQGFAPVVTVVRVVDGVALHAVVGASGQIPAVAGNGEVHARTDHVAVRGLLAFDIVLFKQFLLLPAHVVGVGVVDIPALDERGEVHRPADPYTRVRCGFGNRLRRGGDGCRHGGEKQDCATIGG